MNKVRAIELCLMSIESQIELKPRQRDVIEHHLELFYSVVLQNGKQFALSNEPLFMVYEGNIINTFDHYTEAMRILGLTKPELFSIILNKQKFNGSYIVKSSQYKTRKI
jgi:hypothetical protein